MRPAGDTPACRVLLASLFTPPSTVSATRRPASLTRELHELGYDVTVLTSMVSGTGPVPGATRIVRTRDLLTSGANWRRGNVDALQGSSDADYDAKPSLIARWMPADLQLVTWMPFAVPRALALQAAEPFDCVVTTGPPHSVHLVGLALREKGVPWIADLQDGWTFERPMDRPAAARAADFALERWVLSKADRIVGVTDAMAYDARDRFRVPTATVHLGFDAAESDALAPFADQQRTKHLRPGKHSLVYTGSMAYSGQWPAQFLEGVRQLRKQAPAIANQLDAVFAGPTSIQERALFEEPDVAPNISLLGNLPREHALALQRAADTLLVIIDDTRLGITTNKIFEYLAAGRPIIVLGAGSEAGRLVNELGAGLVVSSSDPAAIAAALEAAVAEKIPSVSRNGPLERYSHAAIGARFAQVIDDCVAADATP